MYLHMVEVKGMLRLNAFIRYCSRDTMFPPQLPRRLPQDFYYLKYGAKPWSYKVASSCTLMLSIVSVFCQYIFFVLFFTFRARSYSSSTL